MLLKVPVGHAQLSLSDKHRTTQDTVKILRKEITIFLMKQSSEVMEEKFRPFLIQMLEISVCELHSDSLRAGRSGDQITVGARFFGACSDSDWGPPNLLCNGYRVFVLWLKRPGSAADHKSPSSAQVKERVQL